MTYRGRVEKGMIRLEGGVELPEGTEVTVRPRSRGDRTAVPGKEPAISRALANLAGKAHNLPADAARNLDHYLYGHAKR